MPRLLKTKTITAQKQRKIALVPKHTVPKPLLKPKKIVFVCVHGGNASSFAREFYSFLKKRGLVRKFKIEIAGFLNLASLSGKKDAAFIVSPLFDPACSTAFISQKEMAAKIRTFFPKAGKITLGFKNNNTEFDTERAFEDILQRAGFGG